MHPAFPVCIFKFYSFSYCSCCNALTLVKTTYLQSVTFPNHWTLATGLHPESHGIVANEFYDPILKKDFAIEDDDVRWWRGEPVKLYIYF